MLSDLIVLGERGRTKSWERESDVEIWSIGLYRPREEWVNGEEFGLGWNWAFCLG